MTQKKYTNLVWTLVGLSLILPIYAWGTRIGWRLENITLYSFFPLFGFLAWMIMWTHYVDGTMRLLRPGFHKPKYYAKITAYTVLACLLLHPGLLAIAQIQNNQGLPPASFVDYVGESAQIAVMLGSLSLLIFLSYEFFIRMRKKSWVVNNWLWVSISQSIAMVLIFVHGIQLGSDISGWFSVVWIVYGIALIPCFYICHLSELQERQKHVKVDPKTS